MTDTITTGVTRLDELLSGLQIGENVVWETDAGSRLDVFVRTFIRSALANDRTLVYVSFNRSPATMHKVLGEFITNERFLLIDCFTSGKGKDDQVFRSYYESGQSDADARVRRIENPGDPKAFEKEMDRIEDECGEGPRYVFDSLTGMQDLWGGESAAYKFFTYTCPRLYDLKTIAYWILEREAHTRAFCAELRHVTQVVIGLALEKGFNTLQVHKAASRSLGPLHADQRYDVVDDEIRFVDASRKELHRVGERMRAARLAKKLSQAEVARMLGVTGSAISQAENGLISLSLQHLINLARALAVRPAEFLDDSPHRAKGGIVSRVNARVEVFPTGTPIAGVSVKALRPDDRDAGVSVFYVTIAPAQKTPRHFLATKGAELGYVLRGSLQAHVGAEKHDLGEGDCILFDDESPTAWRNTGEAESVMLWLCVHR